jgi:hypothetical protein
MTTDGSSAYRTWDSGALVSVALAIGGILAIPVLFPTLSLALALLAIVVGTPTAMRGGSRQSRLMALVGIGLGIGIVLIAVLTVALGGETESGGGEAMSAMAAAFVHRA